MGVWGYSYKENDDYYDNLINYVDPTVQGLKQAHQQVLEKNRGGFESRTTFDEMRPRLMVAYTMLSSFEDISFSEDQVEIISEIVEAVQSASEEIKEYVKEPDEFVAKVAEEMDSIRKWISEFSESSSFAARLSSLTEAVESDQS